MNNLFSLFVLLVSFIGHRSFVLVILSGEVFVKKRRRFKAESDLTSPIETWPMLWWKLFCADWSDPDSRCAGPKERIIDRCSLFFVSSCVSTWRILIWIAFNQDIELCKISCYKLRILVDNGKVMCLRNPSFKYSRPNPRRGSCLCVS